MRVGNQVNFAIVPEWVLFSGLSANAVRLYAVLNRHANKTTGKAVVRRTTLAEEVGGKKPLSTKTVDRCVNELVDLGAVSIKSRFGDQGQRSNEYTVNQVPLGAVQMSIGGDTSVQGVTGDTSVQGPLDTGVPPNESPSEREVTEREKTLASATRKREPDLVFEAVAEVCGIDWSDGLNDVEAGPLRRSVKALKAVDATPDEVRRRAANWPLVFEGATLTPMALAKWWGRLSNIAPGHIRTGDRYADMHVRLNGREVSDAGRTSEPVDQARRSLPA